MTGRWAPVAAACCAMVLLGHARAEPKRETTSSTGSAPKRVLATSAAGQGQPEARAPAKAAPQREERCREEIESAAAGPVDLNTATEAQLLGLPGIGPSRAQAILAFREALGGFTSLSQLRRIKGLGRTTLKRLRPLLTVSSAPAKPPARTSPNGKDRVR